MKAQRAVVLVLLAGLCPARAASDAAATDAAKGFYSAYASFQPSDGIPKASARARLTPYVSTSLNQLLADADNAEARFVGHNKNAPPLIEGDLFTSNFEGATTYSVRKCEAQGATARCVVDLEYDPKTTGTKPVDWSDRLYLLRTGSGWRVDDVGYGSTAAFGNKGRLSDTLKEVIRNAGS